MHPTEREGLIDCGRCGITIARASDRAFVSSDGTEICFACFMRDRPKLEAGHASVIAIPKLGASTEKMRRRA